MAGLSPSQVDGLCVFEVNLMIEGHDAHTRTLWEIGRLNAFKIAQYCAQVDKAHWPKDAIKFFPLPWDEKAGPKSGGAKTARELIDEYNRKFREREAAKNKS